MMRWTFWRLAGALLLLLVGVGGVAGVPGLPAISNVRVAEASVAADRHNDDDDDDDEHNTDQDNKDDKLDPERQIYGQVVSPRPGVGGVNRATNPPEIYVANLDGVVRVMVQPASEIDHSGVAEGDFVVADGEKVSELLFVASRIDVKEHCCGRAREGHDDHVRDPDQNDDDDDGHDRNH